MSKMILFLPILFILFGGSFAEAEDIAVIVNARLNIESVTMEDVKGIYLGKIQFMAGTRLKPIDQNEKNDIRRLFLDTVLHMSKVDYTKHWMHLVFLEGTNPPIIREDGAAVISSIQEMEGGIGYVSAHEAAGAKGVKTLLIVHNESTKSK